MCVCVGCEWVRVCKSVCVWCVCVVCVWECVGVVRRHSALPSLARHPMGCAEAHTHALSPVQRPLPTYSARWAYTVTASTDVTAGPRATPVDPLLADAAAARMAAASSVAVKRTI